VLISVGHVAVMYLVPDSTAFHYSTVRPYPLCIELWHHHHTVTFMAGYGSKMRALSASMLRPASASSHLRRLFVGQRAQAPSDRGSSFGRHPTRRQGHSEGPSVISATCLPGPPSYEMTRSAELGLVYLEPTCPTSRSTVSSPVSSPVVFV
jgi:hypothetical protein